MIMLELFTRKVFIREKSIIRTEKSIIRTEKKLCSLTVSLFTRVWQTRERQLGIVHTVRRLQYI
jgi:hypothetical protein